MPGDSTITPKPTAGTRSEPSWRVDTARITSRYRAPDDPAALDLAARTRARRVRGAAGRHRGRGRGAVRRRATVVALRPAGAGDRHRRRGRWRRPHGDVA